MTKRLPLGCTFVLLFVACGRETAGPVDEAATTGGIRQEPVVVYATHEDPGYWPGRFAGFTRETGIRITVRHRDAATSVNAVIANQGSPPADVLLTPSVYGVWKAADEGALRPLRSDSVDGRVPEKLRDPDGFWAAVRAREALVVHSRSAAIADGLADYPDLADPGFRGQLCLTSSSLPLNRTLLAALIDAHGAQAAELAVRGWVANLALPPFDDEASLRAAIESGTCRLGIISSDAGAGLPLVPDVAARHAVVDIDGIGIARHAREPESALRLIEWLIESEDDLPESRNGSRPLAQAAWRIEEAVKLAERAGYR